MRTFKQLLGVIVGIFVVPSYAASIYDPGIQYCQSNPSVCGLENYGSFENGKNQGISQCQQNPSSCGISSSDTNGSTTDGISQCQRNPASCGLENAGSFENGKNQGVSQCQQNPSSCGIAISSDTNGSTTEGIAQCQQNPASCGLENAGSFENGKNQGISQGVSQCKGNPLSCKIPLVFIETKSRSLPITNITFDDPEIFVYLSSQGFTNDKQQIFDIGLNSSYIYQLISRQRRTSSDPYVFDLNNVNGLQ